MASEEEIPKQRINMAHGFMKSVIRNQIDRDNYDKEVKAKQQVKGKHRPRIGPTKPKKPEMQAYVPPQRSKRDNTQEYLFTLEYEHKSGELHKMTIFKNDQPDTVARKVGAKFDLGDLYVKALSQRIKEEMSKRLV